MAVAAGADLQGQRASCLKPQLTIAPGQRQQTQAGTVAVLGLISTRVPDVESVDFLQRRVEEASHYLPLEQLAVGPRCGLGLPEESIWRKVDAMLETAARVWG